MKKVVITAIVVLFLLVSFEYSNAQQPNLGGKLTGLDLTVTYQQEQVPKDLTKQTVGDKLVTVKSGIKVGTKYNPVLYIRVDPVHGNFLEIDFYWNHPLNGQKILTTSCPPPALISSKPMISTTRPPTDVTDSFKGFSVCTFCPNGINTGTTCNGNLAAGFGILYVEGYVHQDPATNTTTSITINGALDGADFDYLGKDDWASANCTTYLDFPACPAMFIGSYGATLKPCPVIDPQGDPDCKNL